MNAALAAVLAHQVQAGLVAISLSVRPGPGMTTDKVLAELQACEQALSAGHLRQPPQPGAGVPSHIARFLA